MSLSAKRNVGQVPLLLIVATAVILIAPAQARPQSSVQSSASIWSWTSTTDPEIQKCWSVLANVQGCAQEIFKSFVTRKMCLGPACCKAISELSENCLPKVFAWGPFNTLFLPLVQAYCASIGGGALAPPPDHAQAPLPGQDISPNPATPSDQGDLSLAPTEGAEPPQDQGGDAKSPEGGNAPELSPSFEPSPNDGEEPSPSPEFVISSYEESDEP
ncbi:hypothetical protein Sjap_004336 [Stephania japonica]|uniref:Prolamin-like domain-containing protein n=1 Tax=Stephania japonica TaxID=461633 RepID=A0AAP0K239_9MAGN